MKKIKARNAPPVPAGRIRNLTPLTDSEPLRLNFKHLDLTNPKFHHRDCPDGYLEKLLGRLRDLGTYTVKSFRTQHTGALRNHPIDWTRSSEPNGFTCLNEQLRSEEAWQFGISGNEHGRIHGFLIDYTLYIVWVDPKHQLFPGQA
jgi:hypothetical protein